MGQNKKFAGSGKMGTVQNQSVNTNIQDQPKEVWCLVIMGTSVATTFADSTTQTLF